jgi:aspartate racemase
MKLIGILGGTSWPSTVLPYQMLNEEVQRRLGSNHSARIALYSIDYAAIRACYSGDWSPIPGLLLDEIRVLLSFNPDCWMIANNTLHKIWGEIAHALPAYPPMMHAIELVRDHLLSRRLGRVLILGTRFTMEDDYYSGPIRSAGVEVVVPEEADRAHIAAIQTRLADGVIDPAFAPYFTDLISRAAARGCEAVIAGCTELPLVITGNISPIPVIDPLFLQCVACVDFALSS